MVGRFLFGVVTGGALVAGGLVLSSALFPPPADPDVSLAAAGTVTAPQPVTASVPDKPRIVAGVPEGSTGSPLPETMETPAEEPAAQVSAETAGPVAEDGLAAETAGDVTADAPPVSSPATEPTAEALVTDTGPAPELEPLPEAQPEAQPEPPEPATTLPPVPESTVEVILTPVPTGDATAEAETPPLPAPADAPVPEPVLAEPDVAIAPEPAPNATPAEPVVVATAKPAVETPILEAATADETPLAEPAQPEPAQPEPAQPEHALPQPAQPEVAVAEPAPLPVPALLIELDADAVLAALGKVAEAAPIAPVEPVPAPAVEVAVEPPEAPSPAELPDPIPAEVEMPTEPIPAPAEEELALPGAAAPGMPGTRPAVLPGTEPEGEAEPEVAVETAPDAELATDEGSTFKPAPGLAAQPEGVVVGRLPRIGVTPAVVAEATEPGAAPADDRPIARFAAPFVNPDGKPLLALVLIDPGTTDLDRAGLAALPFAVTFALDPLDTATPERAAIYRAAGKEVVMLATGIAEGARASDLEVAFQSMAQGLPEAVAVMDLPNALFQNRRPLASIVVPVVGAQGRGLLTWDAGLNAADQVARREDIAAAVVFRDLASAGADTASIRRVLDRAVFKAGQDGRVAVAGTATAETVAALLEWAVEGRAATVALAPLTAVMTVE